MESDGETMHLVLYLREEFEHETLYRHADRFGREAEQEFRSPVFPVFCQPGYRNVQVHRFAITFHKDKRSKSKTKSELDTIKGIGEKTKVLLLRHFKSVKRIREAGFDELKEVIGEAKTKALLNGLK